MTVWSCSPFLNELDVLEIRLAELDPVVDIFVLVEATMTHSGIPRDLVFPDHYRDRFSEWAHKIRYLVAGFSGAEANWARERSQREQLGRGLVGLRPDDLVIVSDVDEVVSADTVRAALDGDLPLPCSLSFPIHPYRLDWRWDTLEDGFARCTMLHGRYLGRAAHGGASGVHDAVLASPAKAALVGDYGWHFTYCSDAAGIMAKAESIADDWTKGAVSHQAAQAAIRTGVDVFGRGWRTASRVPLSALPRHVQRHPERFAHLLGATT